MPRTTPFAIVESEGAVRASYTDLGIDRYVSISIGDATLFIRNRDDLDTVIDSLRDAAVAWRASEGRELVRDEDTVRAEAEVRESL